AGAAKEIANATDLETCKKIQARLLKDERFIDETAACEIVDLLAFVLRGDNSQSIATPPSSQYASPSTSQSRYAQPQTNANAQNTGVNNASGWISNAAKTIITVIIAIAVGIVVGAIAVFVICCISFLIAGGERIDNLWSSNYDYHSYKIIDHAKKIAAVCGAIGGFIVWLITFYKVNKKLLPKATKDWIKNWRN
ncbi:MAG: hypothetical protein LBF86_08895, partial [Helicobacteraceae bacterium]|nr:hypothetical protein [Helicobacteraceae bacterium]